MHVRHDQNSGLPSLRVNEGLLLSRGEYCAYQFDDDTWTDDALKKRVEALDANPNYGVVYGRTTVRHGEQVGHLGGPFNFSKLVNSNYIANNTVMHRREIFEKHGGYDMHILMRRLCDWDLWLRWARHTRFFFIDEVLSVVDVMMEGSLGQTAQYDVFTSRFQIGRDRDAMLIPGALPDYVVDDLAPYSALGKEKVDEMWRHHMVPYLAPRLYLQKLVQPVSVRKTKLNVIVTKAEFDTNVDITITNLAGHLTNRYAFTFVPSSLLTEEDLATADIVIFHRTIDEHAVKLMEKAQKDGKCAVYLMDDDLLSMHELSPEFYYLAPGQPHRDLIIRQLEKADLVLTYSSIMTESAKAHSANVVQLSTNIESKWLEGVRSERSGPLRIAFAGGGARKEEMAMLKDAIQTVSRRHGGNIEFHFWGCAPEGLGNISSPTFIEPFTFSYSEYLSRLRDAAFDIMLVPLFADKRAKRAKCPIKYLEATSAGAIGIYSDVEPYRAVQNEVTGLKVENHPLAWRKAIEAAIEMSAENRNAMAQRAHDDVLANFSAKAQAKALDDALTGTRKRGSLPIEGPKAPAVLMAGANCRNVQACLHAGRCVVGCLLDNLSATG